MTRKGFRSARKKGWSRPFLWLLAVGSLAATALAATTVKWSGSAARLVFAGGAPQLPLFKVKIDDNKHFFYITARPVFKNEGSESGAIQKVNIEPVGLKEPLRKLEVLRLDRSAIEPGATKEVRCEFLAVVDAAALNPKTPLEFRVHFYGSDNQEVYWEGITIENIDPRSSRSRHGSKREPVSDHFASRPTEI